MPTNIVIGVGGTGAKVAESVLHISAVGLGPDNLTVGFVDQDQSNGNVSRALEAYSSIEKARALWRTSGSNNYIGSGSLFKTDLRKLGTGLWTPHPGAKSSLAQILGDLKDDSAAFDLLFAKGALEQDMRLDEGYRGRAHIGSAAITSAVADRGDFWRGLEEAIRMAKGGESVRILLAGSVFGGTGAAGFPTISRLIRRIIEAEGIDRNIRLGGVLMLPYFRFSAPDDETANVARNEDLLPQTRGALRYYSSLFKREKVFDEIFLVGWNPSFDLGYHEPGTGEQRNPALLPELIAALGASRFFQSDHEANGEVLVSARHKEAAIGWSDIPQPRTGGADHVYKAIGRHLRYLSAWKLWRPILAREGDSWSDAFQGHAWYKKQRLGRIDFRNSPPTDAISAMEEYANSSIEWLATMKAYATEGQVDWGLWNCDPLVDGQADFSSPTKPIKVISHLNEKELNEALDVVIKPLEAADRLPTGASIHYRMNTETVYGEHEGLGRFVASLNDFSGVRGAN